MQNSTRRNFVKPGVGVGALTAAMPLLNKAIFAEIRPVCDTGPCGPGGGINRATVDYHNRNVAPASIAAQSNSLTSTQVDVAQINHMDNWNYYQSLGEEQNMLAYMQDNTATALADPSPDAITKLQNQFGLYGVTWDYDTVTGLIYVPSSQRQIAIDYANASGFYTIATAQARLLAAKSGQVGGGFGGGGGGAFADDCANFAAIQDTLNLLAVLYALAALAGCVPCVGIAAGIALVSAVLRYQPVRC
jgi:hypothetical protein